MSARLPETTSPLAGPVFVLCAGRSGSTLLRFVLDAHPELACPPETRLPALCAQLVQVSTQLAGPSSVTATGAIPAAVADRVREAVWSMVRPYLARRGKRWYCDKSLGTAEHASVLAQVFPGARFLCLYRHPMDLIASGLEATPWGLTGFGFDPYAARSPGNAVLALANYWTDHATAIHTFEQAHPDRCHRVRYEDLVADPQHVADEIFDALGVPRVDGIEAACFSEERERHGPADYKIWHTNKISTGSVGRGWNLPANLVTPNTLDKLNQMVDKLSYRRVDYAWGTAPIAPDMRVALPARPVTQDEVPHERVVAFPAAYQQLGSRLQAGVFRLDHRFTDRWQPRSSEAFLLTASQPDGNGAYVRWRVDLAAQTVTTQSGRTGGAQDDVGWELTGSTTTWEGVLAGRVNLGLALRNRTLIYAHRGDHDASALTVRVAMLEDLVGISAWVAPTGGGARFSSAQEGAPGSSSAERAHVR